MYRIMLANALLYLRGTYFSFAYEMQFDSFLTVYEAAEQIHCSPQHIRKLLRTGDLAGSKMGDTWLVSTDSVDNYSLAGKKTNNQIQDQKSFIKPKKGKMKALSFFSGAMGLDLGLEKAGIETLLACEFDKASRITIHTNRPKLALIGDILDYSAEDVLHFAGLENKHDVDLIVGGPPCQAFSTAGKRLGFQDHRGNVFLKYLELVEAIRPRYAVIENVRGLLSSAINIEDPFLESIGLPIQGKPGSSLFYVKKRLENAGYSITFNLYNSANFGTPQIRERVVLIATLDDNPVPFLTPTHDEFGRYGLKPWKTFAEATECLSETEKDFIKYSEKRLRFLRMLGPGQNWRNLPEEVQLEAMGKSYLLGGGKTGFYRRLGWDRPSPTVVTHPAMPATELAHPEEDRPLSVQEYKRIQQFPDDWKICGKITDQYRQVGNAVPVGLGEAIGKAIVSHSQGKMSKQFEEFSYSRYKKTGTHEFVKSFVDQFKEQSPKIYQLEFEF
ncbi:DNA cytosine methyltransferase [Dyadobacter sp. LJ53]|uniref:DNA cytosine methyltransferase n=1 Tax=Dyadobacter chenwenxiniae TaxID=2906456 RepID=UPI001F322F9D|nr:DNA cytosine methyltransferase [Dyadobacter chenwenxiniae]MCF0052993.1 DNA cytosine methyltransferase [Dyadobacter chenwenxiniae]